MYEVLAEVVRNGFTESRHYGSVGTADRAQRLRRAQFLLRRGFATATVRSVTQADVDETADPEN